MIAVADILVISFVFQTSFLDVAQQSIQFPSQSGKHQICHVDWLDIYETDTATAELRYSPWLIKICSKCPELALRQQQLALMALFQLQNIIACTNQQCSGRRDLGQVRPVRSSDRFERIDEYHSITHPS